MSKAAELLGVLSTLNLQGITARFLKEIGSRLQADSSSLARAELLALCYGMRWVRLSMRTDSEVSSLMGGWCGILSSVQSLVWRDRP